MKRITLFLSVILFAGLLLSGCVVFLDPDEDGEYYYEKFRVTEHDFEVTHETLFPDFRDNKDYRDRLKKRAVSSKVTIGRDASKQDLLRIMRNGGCGDSKAAFELSIFPAARNHIFHYEYRSDSDLIEILYVEKM